MNQEVIKKINQLDSKISNDKDEIRNLERQLQETNSQLLNMESYCRRLENKKILPENIAAMLNLNEKDNLNVDYFYGKGIKKNIPSNESEIAIFLEKK